MMAERYKNFEIVGKRKKFFFNTDISRNLFARTLFFPFLQFFYSALHHFF